MPGRKKAKTRRRKSRTQVSLEYLITYGWALVMIATIVGVMVFVAGGGISSNTCTTFLVLLCKGIGADGDMLILVLQNATGQKITINPFVDIRFDDKMGYAIVTYQGKEYRFDDVTIAAGDQFTIEGIGMAHAEQLTLTYYENSTGLTKTITSNLKTDAPQTIEISNDGIDNDGDNLVDCADPALSNCEYTVEAEAGYPTTIDSTLPAETIVFGAVKTPKESPLTGMWWASDRVALAFYVESFVEGTGARVTFSGNITNVTLKQGWNVAEIPLGASVMIPGPSANMPDFTIASTGEPFTISGTEIPSAYVKINSP